jgi:myo-inositol 2-dehydrogenase/D-chiro-inositol 1-dehydrogenase
MLRFGLLGCDAAIAGVAHAAVGRGDALVAGHQVGEPWNRDLPVPPIDSWEPLIDPRTTDVVLVGSDGWSDRRAEAVRTLVQAGRTLVLSQPLELSMLWAYELDMIRRDTGAVLVPCLPDRLHPLIGRLRSEIEAAAAGVGDLVAVESIHFERRLVDRSKEAVLSAFCRDADLVRALVGDPERLSTLAAAADVAWPSLAIGLTSATGIPTRWQVAPAGAPGLSIRLQSAHGVVAVDAPDGPDLPWTWNDTPFVAFDRARATLHALDAAVGRGTAPRPMDAVPPATWSDASRAIELAETVPRSLARGRAIDLHREEFTDLGTFRGTMASLGCGLIMMALVVVVVATLVAGVAREFGWAAAGGVADSWPAIVLVVLGLFLALQTIPLLLRGPAEPPGRDGKT